MGVGGGKTSSAGVCLDEGGRVCCLEGVGWGAGNFTLGGSFVFQPKKPNRVQERPLLYKKILGFSKECGTKSR